MTRSDPPLSEVHRKKIAPLVPPSTTRAAARGARTVVFPKEFCGFSGAALVGRTCRKSINIPRRAGGGWGDCEGQSVWLNICRTFLNELNERQQPEFHSREKRAQESEKPSGAGDEVDGGGRQRGCLFGRRPSLCVPGGSPVGKDGARGAYSIGSLFILAHWPVA